MVQKRTAVPPSDDSNDDRTTAHADRLRAIFEAATEQDPRGRSDYLALACGGDVQLRSQVEQLLAAHASEGSWLDRPVLNQPLFGSILRHDDNDVESDRWVGQRLGPYRLIKQIGSGGMATVYLAERSIGKATQQVALKMIRPSFTTNPDMMRRFEHEREILASLDHPNIARLLDIGSTDTNVPYLVMEYVEGERIDLYCDVRRLPIVDRLVLFCHACAAIDYAHSKGVVHRDLKPSNILITANGSVRLLDFGIAKVLRQEAQTQTLLTGTGAALMTIEYASPEQVRGEPIGPQSDVYSLGVLLYELLTGCRPYQADSRLAHVIARAICEEPALAPSNALRDLAQRSGVKGLDLEQVTALRSDTPKELNRKLRGDLDHILLKALRKEPRWRYGSPGELADDIRRHLAGTRISARDNTFHYRMERVVRRVLHPADVAFHTQGMMMVTAGLLGIMLLYERHEILTGAKQRPDVLRHTVAFAAWLVWTLWEGRQMVRFGRLSALDRQSWTTFTVITVIAGALTVVSQIRHSLTPEAVALFWNAALSIGFFIVGLQANRLLTAGAVALFASTLAAAFYPAQVYLLIAAGIAGGMVIPGLLFAYHGAKFRPLPSLTIRKRDTAATE